MIRPTGTIEVEADYISMKVLEIGQYWVVLQPEVWKDDKPIVKYHDSRLYEGEVIIIKAPFKIKVDLH